MCIKLIVPFIYTAMSRKKNRVQMHAGAIRKLLYSLCVCSSVVRHLPLVLEVPGSIPARGEKNFGVRTRFL